MNNEEKTIAEVVPAVKFPRDVAPSFSYRIPKHMKGAIRTGDVVLIPFRRREVLGAVESISKDRETGFELKEIKEIVSDMSLSEEQIKIARFIAQRYFVPLGFILKMILPETPKKPARKDMKFSSLLLPEKLQEGIEEKISGTILESNKALLIHSLEKERHLLYQNIIPQNSGAQTLLLFPEYFDIYAAAQSYINRFGKEQVAVLCSNITKNQYFAEWQKVKSGKAIVVIGTRQAVFAPFCKLKFIVVDESQNSSYKQWDQNPRYHGVEAATKLAEIWEAKIILSSPLPSAEDYHRAKNDFALVDASERPGNFPQIVDMDTERKSGNFSFVSEKLKEELIKNAYARKQSLVFIPRLGEKTIYQCKDCGHIAECETCKTPLIGYRNKLYCSRCKQLYGILKECSDCQGQNIGSFGGGSGRVFEEIQEIFEGKNLKIVELDSSSEEGSSGQKILEEFNKGKIDILIGTQMAWKNWQMENLGLIGIIFPEIIFSVPGFRSGERSRQFLAKACNLTKERTVIIQTRKPDHKYFQEIKEKEIAELLEEEYQSRSESISLIPYPPFGKLIKLIYKHSDPRDCEKEAKWQYECLKKEIYAAGLLDKMEVMPPFPAQNYREYGKYRWHIIIRHLHNLPLPDRDRVLKSAKKDWIIDVDPDEIL